MVIITYNSAADAKDIILNKTKPAIYAFRSGSGSLPLDMIEFIYPPKNWYSIISCKNKKKNDIILSH